MRPGTLSRALLLLTLAAAPLRADFNATLTSVGPGTVNSSYEYYIVGINWTQTPTADSPAVPWLNSTFTSFCIEVNQDVYVGGQVTFKPAALTAAPVGDVNSPPNPMSGMQATQIERMWAQDYASLSTGNVNDNYAAFQIAIWTILGYTTILNQPIYANTDQSQVAALANQFVSDSQNTNYATLANLVALTSPIAQDQITQLNGGYTLQDNGPMAMPAPPGLALMLSGIVPLLALLRLRVMSGR